MKNIIIITLIFISNLCIAQNDIEPPFGYVDMKKLTNNDEAYLEGGDHIPDVVLKHKPLKTLEILYYLGKSLPDFGNFKELKKLRIGGLHFASIPKSISEADNLQEIRLGGIKTKIDISYFYTLKQLKTLQIINSKVEIIPNGIKELQNLEVLYLHSNDIKQMNDEIYKLINLKELTLEGISIKNISNDIQKLENLERLSILNADLGKINPKIFKLKKLKYLSFFNNSQIKTIPKEIYNCKSLEVLNITNTQVSVEEIQKIKEKLPNLRIISE